MRSSMALRLSARRSNSSPVPVTSSRPERSPLMILRLGRRQRIDALEHPPADEDPGQRRQADHQRQRPGERLGDDVAELLALAEVAADQHVVAARQVDQLDEGEVLLRDRRWNACS